MVPFFHVSNTATVALVQLTPLDGRTSNGLSRPDRLATVEYQKLPSRKPRNQGKKTKKSRQENQQTDVNKPINQQQIIVSSKEN